MEIDTSGYIDDLKRISYGDREKTQILLCHTGCSIDTYLNGLKGRYNGNYNKIPHFTIDISGQIRQHMDPSNFSSFMGNYIDKQAIIIVLENFGPITKDFETKSYSNWAGELYFGEFIEQKWRQKFLWATYSDEQYLILSDLIKYLCINHNIANDFIWHNTKTEDAPYFKGILNRSNYSMNFYDLSPAMDFLKLQRLILT